MSCEQPLSSPSLTFSALSLTKQIIRALLQLFLFSPFFGITISQQVLEDKYHYTCIIYGSNPHLRPQSMTAALFDTARSSQQLKAKQLIENPIVVCFSWKGAFYVNMLICTFVFRQTSRNLVHVLFAKNISCLHS